MSLSLSALLWTFMVLIAVMTYNKARLWRYVELVVEVLANYHSHRFDLLVLHLGLWFIVLG